MPEPFALVRYDLGDKGIDYVEYYLTPSRERSRTGTSTASPRTYSTSRASASPRC